MTLQTVIDDLVRAFGAAGFDQPQFEARQLVQEGLGLTFSQMMSQPDREIDEAATRRVMEWKKRRLKGEPLAYLSGRKGFYKYDFHVEPGVLVPRPETELIVETALRRLEDKPGPSLNMADLGAGSGCIGLSLISELTEMNLWAVDISKKACEVTMRNAQALGVEDRVRIENRPVEGWEPGLLFDLIVANPPYISETDTNVESGVRKYEPAEALFSGEDGLEALRQWSQWALRHLQPKGIFVCEFGSTQGRNMQDMIAKEGFDQIQLERDLAGHDRVISALKK
jgi:release factor glutamine methyltransferase